MKVHRVVTGRNRDAKSIFVAASDAPTTHDFLHIPGMSSTQVWATTPAPVLPARFVDPTETTPSVVPQVGGTQLLFIQFPPDSVFRADSFDPAAAAAETAVHSPGLAELFEADDPGMHTTDTIDYGIVLEGEIWLELDDGKMEQVRKHQVVIQNGTRHAWRNFSDEPALVAFVLIGAKRIT